MKHLEILRLKGKKLQKTELSPRGNAPSLKTAFKRLERFVWTLLTFRRNLYRDEEIVYWKV